MIFVSVVHCLYFVESDKWFFDSIIYENGETVPIELEFKTFGKQIHKLIGNSKEMTKKSWWRKLKNQFEVLKRIENQYASKSLSLHRIRCLRAFWSIVFNIQRFFLSPMWIGWRKLKRVHSLILFNCIKNCMLKWTLFIWWLSIENASVVQLIVFSLSESFSFLLPKNTRMQSKPNDFKKCEKWNESALAAWKIWKLECGILQRTIVGHILKLCGWRISTRKLTLSARDRCIQARKFGEWHCFLQRKKEQKMERSGSVATITKRKVHKRIVAWCKIVTIHQNQSQRLLCRNTNDTLTTDTRPTLSICMFMVPLAVTSLALLLKPLEILCM